MENPDNSQFAQIGRTFEREMAKYNDFFSAPISGRYFSIKNTGDSELRCNDYGGRKEMREVLRIFDFFTNLNFMFSLNPWLLNLYYSDPAARKAMLTDGILIQFIAPKDASCKTAYGGEVLQWYAKTDVDSWNQTQLDAVKQNIVEFLERICGKVNPGSNITDLGLGICWGFWGGCEMTIPWFVTTRLDATLHMCRLEITEPRRIFDDQHHISAQENSKQLVIVEDPNAIFITSIGKWDALYGSKNPETVPKKLQDRDIISMGKSRLQLGDMNAFEIGIWDGDGNGSKYEYCLVLPILNPSYDMLTTAYLNHGKSDGPVTAGREDGIKKGNYCKIVATTCC